MRGKQRNIFAAFGERGHFEWKDIQAVKQILPESSFLDLLAQIAVRGGNDPHIHLDDSLSTKPLDLSLLNHACMLSGSSPISSRKMVQPSPSSNNPFCWATAPVKAPFSYLSVRVGHRKIGP